MIASVFPAPQISVVVTDGNILSGTGSPVGVVSAAGPAVYFDNTNPQSPVYWIKSTATVDSSTWVLVGTFSNS